MKQDSNNRKYESNILVTINMIKHNCVLDFLIPFPTFTDEQLENVVIYYDRIGILVLNDYLNTN
jgi:hypothetical protein